MKNGFKLTLAAFAIISTSFLTSCDEDEHVPPAMVFKTGNNYVSNDMILGVQDTFVVGVDATKTEDELDLFNVSVAYDGGSGTTIASDTLDVSQEDAYSVDVTLVTRNQTGTEKYSFTIIDRDGNITSKDITITVQ